MKKPQRCVGCEERCDLTTKVDGLGYVCELCMEVIDIVWEVELARIREARQKVEAFVEDLQAGRV